MVAEIVGKMIPVLCVQIASMFQHIKITITGKQNPQCGNVMINLSLIFYVKSTLGIVEVQNL